MNPVRSIVISFIVKDLNEIKLERNSGNTIVSLDMIDGSAKKLIPLSLTDSHSLCL